MMSFNDVYIVSIRMRRLPWTTSENCRLVMLHSYSTSSKSRKYMNIHMQAAANSSTSLPHSWQRILSTCCTNQLSSYREASFVSPHPRNSSRPCGNDRSRRNHQKRACLHMRYRFPASTPENACATCETRGVDVLVV